MEITKLFKNSITKLFILLGAMAIIGSCSGVQVNNHSQLEYGTVKIQMSRTEWDSYHRQLAVETMRELNRLGPTFQLVETGGDVEIFDVDLSGGCHEGTRTTTCAAQYLENSRRIEIDPVRTPGALMFQATLMHEVGHFLGMQHICRYAGEAAHCSPVGMGPAVMNPQLTYNSQNIEIGEVTVEVPTFQIQRLDIVEFTRVWIWGNPPVH